MENNPQPSIDLPPELNQSTPHLWKMEVLRWGKILSLISAALITALGIALVTVLVYSKSFSTEENQSVESDNQSFDQVVTPDTGSGISYPIVDTNQPYCFGSSSTIPCGSDFKGQDAEYDGNQPKYQDNGDGTITDLITGLTWVKSEGKKQSYSEALAAAETFSLAGYDDWRVPTIKELYSLMDFNGTDPSGADINAANLRPFIDTDYFSFEYGDTSAGSRIIDSQWITSNIYTSTVFKDQECFFGVNFADGRIKCYPTATANHNQGYFVRYVRGNLYGENSFSDNGDGSIADKFTELTWQQEDSGEGLTWESALAYCEDLSLSGVNNWRLPNAKELQSLVEYSLSPDTSNSPALDPVFDSTQILNEAGQKDWPFYWTSTTHMSQRDGRAAVYIAFGRALGYMQEFGGWVDVHGAGAQRSDDKVGDPEDYPQGFGPQGDAKRFYNYARCVRGGVTPSTTPDTSPDALFNQDLPANSVQQASPSSANPSLSKEPPQEAISACDSKREGSICQVSTPEGNLQGECRRIPNNALACVPS